MRATIDISLYALSDDYRNTIIQFVLNLKKTDAIKVETNGMSTQIFGDYDVLMNLLQTEMKQVLMQTKAVFVLKIASGERIAADIPIELKG